MGGQRPGQTSHDIRQASSLLGISKDAVRKRIKRGTVDAEKDNNGQWVVYLDVNKGVDGLDESLDKGVDNDLDADLDEQDKNSNGYMLLIEQLKKNNEFLEQQLKVKDEQIKAKDEQIKVKDQQLLNQQLLEHGKQQSQLLLDAPKKSFFKRMFSKD